MTSEEFLKKIKFAVLSVDDKADIILFGSRARGDNKPDSDWDLLILVESKRSIALERKLRDDIYEIELEHDQPVSSIILNKKEWEDLVITPFYYNVTHEGKSI